MTSSASSCGTLSALDQHPRRILDKFKDFENGYVQGTMVRRAARSC